MPIDIISALQDTNALALAALAGLSTLLIVAVLAVCRLARERRRLRPYLHTFDTASVGLTHTTMDGRWIRVNPKMAEITGYTVEELVSQSFRDLTVDDDLQRNVELHEKLISGEIDSYTLQKRYRRKDGELIWVQVTPSLARRGDGAPDFYISVIEDIDEMKRAELALQESEARFRAFWDNSPFNQSVKDVHGRLLQVNKTYRRTYGLPDDDISGRSLAEAHDDDWAPQIDDFDREVLRTRTTRTADVNVPAKNDEELTIRVTKFPVYDANNKVVGVGGVSYDITSQVRAAQDIREREERFRATFDQAAVGIAHLSVDGQWLRINERYCEILGYSDDELRKRSFKDLTHHDDLEADLRARDALINGSGGSYSHEKRYIHKDGSIVWANVTASKTEQQGSLDPYLIVVVEDIGDRKQAEFALAARIEQQAAIMDIGQQALAEPNLDKLLRETANLVAKTLDVDICLISQRDYFSRAFRITAANTDGQKYLGWPVEPRLRGLDTFFEAAVAKPVIVDRDDPESPDVTSPIIEDIGTVSAVSVVIAGDDRGPFGVLVVHNRTRRKFTDDDVTFLQSIANVLSATVSRDRIATELAEREDMLNTVLDNAADAIIVTDANGSIVLANRAAEDIFTYSEEEIEELNLRDLVPISYEAHPGSSDIGPRPQFSTREMIGIRRDGAHVPIEVAMTQFESPKGTIHIALVRDITEQKSLQSQLNQASKLATVGEMAAGIAHELNQPLNIMRMAADNVLIRMDAGTADLDYAEENLSLISEQAGRMGKIILHMRVFSRQDTSDFRPFDPSRAVNNACELMRSQLELEGIELNVTLPDNNQMVKGSESQLEQVLINMITNARDSIREATTTANSDQPLGTIGVSVSQQDDDTVACIRVRDTGGGISDDTLERIFDPFFTTKEVGVGTGLGLSVSYGIVNAMGGSIVARNVEGGCEFVVELPVTDEAEDPEDTPLPTLQAQELR